MEERRGVSYLSEKSFTKLFKRTTKQEHLSEFFGLEVICQPFMPDDIVRVVHVDGRVQIIKIEHSDFCRPNPTCPETQ